MIKAIGTVYKGYRFRSRLEARWAVYFDAVKSLAGIVPFSWEYEREGFDLNGIWYLPDFYLRFGFKGVIYWAEIKPEQFTNEQVDLCIELAKQTKSGCFMLSGVPDDQSYPLAWLSGGVFQCNCFRSRYACAMARSARFEHGESPVVV